MKKMMILLLAIALNGCIRLTGGAGYSYQGADDEEATTKQVGFDTQNIIPGARRDPQIEMAAS